MGNKKSSEYQPLLDVTTFSVYCEKDEKQKTVTLTDTHMVFLLQVQRQNIPFTSIREAECIKMWPLMCSHEDILYIDASEYGQLWFGGKNVEKLYRSLQQKVPYIKTKVTKV